MERSAQNAFAVEYARNIRDNDPGMGMAKIWHKYQQDFRSERSVLGRDQFLTLLTNEGMKVRRKPRKTRTTDSSHGLPTFPDLAKSFIPQTSNQLWVSDITYIPIWHANGNYIFCYLSLIMDAYSKEIIGWSIGDSLKTEYPLKALEMALVRIKDKNVSLIHHSDRGVQYASSEYVQLLKKNNIKISMTETGDPKDNAQAERINNTMKNELLKDMEFHCIGAVKDAVDKATHYYNNSRPHMSLNMLTPVQASTLYGPIHKRWTSYREKAIQRETETKAITSD